VPLHLTLPSSSAFVLGQCDLLAVQQRERERERERENLFAKSNLLNFWQGFQPLQLTNSIIVVNCLLSRPERAYVLHVMFFSFGSQISEVPRPIAVKLCHMI